MQDKFEILRIFCRAAESQSFKQAAVSLGISPQVVTRAIKELESVKGEILFHRNTRQIQLTAFGELLHQQSKPLVQEMGELFLSKAKDASDELKGKVTIAAPLGFGRAIAAPVLVDILKAFPDINVDLRLSDKRADVVEERIDIGLRVGFVRDNRYIVKRLSPIKFYVVAAKALIDKVGIPKTPEDLANFPVSSVHDPGTGKEWPWYFKGSGELNYPQSRIIVDDAQAEFTAVKEGLVFAQAPSFLADPLLKTGEIVRVLEDYEPEPWVLYLYRPQRGPVPKRVRVMFDALAERIIDRLDIN